MDEADWPPFFEVLDAYCKGLAAIMLHDGYALEDVRAVIEKDRTRAINLLSVGSTTDSVMFMQCSQWQMVWMKHGYTPQMVMSLLQNRVELESMLPEYARRSVAAVNNRMAVAADGRESLDGGKAVLSEAAQTDSTPVVPSPSRPTASGIATTPLARERKRKRGRREDPERDAQILERRNSGESAQSVALAFGLATASAVYKAAKRAELRNQSTP